VVHERQRHRGIRDLLHLVAWGGHIGFGVIPADESGSGGRGNASQVTRTSRRKVFANVIRVGQGICRMSSSASGSSASPIRKIVSWETRR
jgi:hypothetical protein